MQFRLPLSSRASDSLGVAAVAQVVRVASPVYAVAASAVSYLNSLAGRGYRLNAAAAADPKLRVAVAEVIDVVEA